MSEKNLAEELINTTIEMQLVGLDKFKTIFAERLRRKPNWRNHEVMEEFDSAVKDFTKKAEELRELLKNMGDKYDTKK